MTTSRLNPDALQTLHLLRCGPHVLEVLAAAIHGQEAAEARIDSLTVQRDAAEALAREATVREDALGLQVVAQSARLRLADGLAKAWAAYDRGIQRASGYLAPSPVGQFVESDDLDAMYEAILSAKAAWDAVPGDVVKKAPSPHCPKCKSGCMAPDGDATYCDLMCGYRTEPDHFDTDKVTP